MQEALGDMLAALSSVLHWFGKYNEANAVSLTARLVRTLGITTREEYEAWIQTVKPLAGPSSGADEPSHVPAAPEPRLTEPVALYGCEPPFVYGAYAQLFDCLEAVVRAGHGNIVLRRRTKHPPMDLLAKEEEQTVEAWRNETGALMGSRSAVRKPMYSFSAHIGMDGILQIRCEDRRGSFGNGCILSGPVAPPKRDYPGLLRCLDEAIEAGYGDVKLAQPMMSTGTRLGHAVGLSVLGEGTVGEWRNLVEKIARESAGPDALYSWRVENGVLEFRCEMDECVLAEGLDRLAATGQLVDACVLSGPLRVASQKTETAEAPT